MSTLSSSLSALSSSTMSDLYEKFSQAPLTDAQGLRLGRFFTLAWELVFIGAASLFTGTDNPVVELGLSVAGLTYGGLLGSFFFGLWDRKARQVDAVIGFTWYTAIGVVITVGLGFLLSRRHPEASPLADRTREEGTRLRRP